MDRRPYTRIAPKVQKKSFIRGAPGIKVRVFNMGNIRGTYTYTVDLVSDQRILIRQEALEAARVTVNRPFQKHFAGKKGYYAKLLVYPHHIVRENKMLTGAGADRMQTGMSRSFGKKIARAARVSKDQSILRIYLNEEELTIAKKAMKIAKYKLPGKFLTKITKLDQPLTLSAGREKGLAMTPKKGQTLEEMLEAKGKGVKGTEDKEEPKEAPAKVDNKLPAKKRK